MNRRLMLGVVVALGVSSLAGCGGGGATSGEQRVCSAETFVPNYVPLLERLLYWERFPVTVYFERDANYSDYYRTLARQGFDQWVEATGGVVRVTARSTRPTAHRYGSCSSPTRATG
jgi:hypothetical protein